ncbi:DUF448 domain-containing protein [Nitratiruptor sp. YY09-18]|uniref:DUF448 domain-containing protein n=1 Tax=Nitratiruptor sp. YY09-18 TaxID=2724901 RepID=UPI00193500FF|nr:DUF448 domain-containing protein [Nitratiruptor sp. YY09-18]BCD67577.1 hypothetical protein NitYY0918_C0476 [Nitratiruptor sp. YY09-18]
MCIHCKNRFYQNELYRLQCKEKRIYAFSGFGRSFYLCKSCIDDTKLPKSLARICKVDPTTALKMLKEIVENG